MVHRNGRSLSRNGETLSDFPAIPGIDAFRTFIFPNNIRKHRKARDVGSLLQLSQKLPSLTYIRLSKIERGEIVARADEIRSIAAALDVGPDDLLVDIDDPAFDIAVWAKDFLGPDSIDTAADSMAVMLAAAVRARRAADEALTIAAVERTYGIAPVILSRIENALKPLDRWSPEIQHALFRLFEVPDTKALTQLLLEAHAGGHLDATLPLVANPEIRTAKTRAKVQALRDELATAAPAARPRASKKAAQPRLHTASPSTSAVPPPVLEAIHADDTATVRLLPVFGAPLADGLIARVATGEQVEAPRNAGPRAYGLRICRPSLGSGLPGRSIIIVDPDRFPSAGGLAVVREKDGLRLLSVTFDRQGHMLGYSEHPDREIAIDDLEPDAIATVLSAQFE